MKALITDKNSGKSDFITFDSLNDYVEFVEAFKDEIAKAVICDYVAKNTHGFRGASRSGDKTRR